VTTVLLDANVLIALVVAEHVHHAAAETWLADSSDRFATCPITEGSLVRLLLREGQSAESAKNLVAAVAADPRHDFWPDGLSYQDVRMAGVVGHRQVTDAYLAQLARANDGRLASFDQGLAKLHGDVVDLVPTA
jgi:toxin-antitoxin system PIN domain toxin